MEACGNLEKVIETTPEAFKGLDMAIFSSGSDISLKFAEDARRQECVVIDNSSAFRMDPQVPLVIHEINASALEEHRGIIANPNCSTAVTLMGLYPLHRRFGLKRLITSTYQAVSGAGAAGLTTLLNELNEDPMNSHDTQESPFPYPIAFNLITPHR